MLARAFYDDPVWVWALPDGSRRRRVLPWVFARIVALEARRVHAVGDGEGKGVALWVPPGSPPPRSRDLWRAGFPLVAARLGREGSRRVDAFQVASRTLLIDLGSASSWFLSGLGVDPGAQRSGIGTQLVEWGIERAAEAGRPAVLLTSNVANIPFYERLGLHVAAEEELPRGGVLTWAMQTRQSSHAFRSSARRA